LYLITKNAIKIYTVRKLTVQVSKKRAGGNSGREGHSGRAGGALVLGLRVK
jgi:hypothetical protein